VQMSAMHRKKKGLQGELKKGFSVLCVTSKKHAKNWSGGRCEHDEGGAPGKGKRGWAKLNFMGRVFGWSKHSKRKKTMWGSVPKGRGRRRASVPLDGVGCLGKDSENKTWGSIGN